MTAELPEGWTEWHAGADGMRIWAFRPDVFDGSEFPAGCLPTLSLKPQRARGPRGYADATADRGWCVELRLEPDVCLKRRTDADREPLLETAQAFATAFVAGELELRSGYADPHEAYLSRLEELVGVE